MIGSHRIGDVMAAVVGCGELVVDVPLPGRYGDLAAEKRNQQRLNRNPCAGDDAAAMPRDKAHLTGLQTVRDLLSCGAGPEGQIIVDVVRTEHRDVDRQRRREVSHRLVKRMLDQQQATIAAFGEQLEPEAFRPFDAKDLHRAPKRVAARISRSRAGAVSVGGKARQRRRIDGLGKNADKVSGQIPGRPACETLPSPGSPQEAHARLRRAPPLGAPRERDRQTPRTVQQRRGLQYFEARLAQHPSQLPRTRGGAHRVGDQLKTVQQPGRQGVAERHRGVGEIVHRQQQPATGPQRAVQSAQRLDYLIAGVEVVERGI